MIVPGSTLDWATRRCPEPEKTKVLTILELSDLWRAITRQNTEISVLKTKLAWWKLDLARAAKGQADHPLLKRFDTDLAWFQERQPLWQAWLSYHERCLEPVVLESSADFEHHAHQIGSVREWLLLGVFCKSLSREDLAWCNQAALALEQAEVLQHLAWDLVHGRLLLPKNLLENLGCDPLALLKNPKEASVLSSQWGTLWEDTIAELKKVSEKGPAQALTTQIIAAITAKELQRRSSISPLHRAWIAHRVRTLTFRQEGARPCLAT